MWVDPITKAFATAAFGDGGLVVAMFWGLALLVINITGLVIDLMMRRPNATGLRRVFW